MSIVTQCVNGKQLIDKNHNQGSNANCVAYYQEYQNPGPQTWLLGPRENYQAGSAPTTKYNCVEGVGQYAGKTICPPPACSGGCGFMPHNDNYYVCEIAEAGSQPSCTPVKKSMQPPRGLCQSPGYCKSGEYCGNEENADEFIAFESVCLPCGTGCACDACPNGFYRYSKTGCPVCTHPG